MSTLAGRAGTQRILYHVKYLASRHGYPMEYPLDIVEEAREFYRLFLGVDVSEREIRKIMGK